ncbi:hypothetical protein AALA22_09230 [Anaerovoracaceae bacterium 41-7]|uniref:hypothetical protein n=1 Tax=Anaerotruncus sp. 80 TaxID=2304566 RepID=UPI001FADC6B0|nr:MULTISPECIES: hypothetical protein [Anaerotruncus]
MAPGSLCCFTRRTAELKQGTEKVIITTQLKSWAALNMPLPARESKDAAPKSRFRMFKSSKDAASEGK